MIYRDQFHACLDCSAPLKDAYAAGHRFEQCPECRAQWVEEAQLACMYLDLAGPDARPEFSEGPGEPQPPGHDARRCIVCENRLSPVQLQQVAVYRCEQHGIWFDPNELQTVLERVALAATPPR